jgi:hypothetical protein
MAAVLGVVVVVGLALLGLLFDYLLRADTRPVHRRGGKLLTQREAGRLAATRGHGRFVPSAGFLGLSFGGLKLPLEFFWTGILFIGAIGVGKTTLFMLLIRDIVRLVNRGAGARLVLLDPKREFLGPVLASAEAFVRVIVLNPFDRRATAWNMAGTFRTFAQAVQFAAALIPDSKEPQKFFIFAARSVLAQLVWTLIQQAPGAWTLGDVLYIARSRKRLTRYLARTPEGKDIVEKYLKARSGRDVIASLASYLDPLIPVAAAMSRATSSVSVREILDTDCVVIFSLDDGYSETLKPLAALFARALSDEILLRNDPTKPTFILVDELVSWGHLDLTALTGKGRSAGAAVVATVQELAALEAVHGETKARALLGTLLTQAHLRVSSDKTAKFCAAEIGDREVEETESSYPGGGGPPTLSKRVQTRGLVLPDELKSLPAPDWKAGRVSGYFRLADLGTYRADVNFRDEPEPPPSPAPEYDRRPREDETLRRYDRHDLVRLGLPVTPLWLSLFQVKVI